ncbi:papain-like cysteine protease family protein [Microcoleus sp. bin38.metabat.b11b12b14.051]|uniref:cysteine peptidase family C39 domain-containing protein n=1 Tax=Microcoleus sp. bin38.metabat.b11b12b14.051 TaxID=2742709 RepID=UPI003458D5C4
MVDSTVVRQQSNLSCGPASAEILLKDRGIANIEQDAIENLTGAPTSAEEIANALNELTPATSHQWQAGFIDTSTPLAAFNLLLNTEQSWMAQMKEFGNRVGHMVVVDGLDVTGLVLIRDPWEGTRYKMNIDEFLKVWNQIAVF